MKVDQHDICRFQKSIITKNELTMKTIKIFKLNLLFLFILIATQSCVVSSLHPLYTKIDLCAPRELNGTWIDNDKTIYEVKTMIDSTKSKSFKTKDIKDNEMRQKLTQWEKESDATIKFSTTNHYYKIKIITKKDTAVYEGRVSKLKDHYFLDIMPDDNMLEKRIDNVNLIGLVAPMHGILKLRIKANELQLNAIEYDDFEKLIKAKKIRMEYIERGDRIIITSKTSDIQKFLIKFADTELFNNLEDALILKRLNK